MMCGHRVLTLRFTWVCIHEPHEGNAHYMVRVHEEDVT